MLSVEFDPKDVMSLNVALKALEPGNLLEGEWRPFMMDIIDVVWEYPPEIPGSTYIRTGHLGISWGHEVLTPLSAEVFNYAIYAGDVHGHEQMAVHAGHGWKKLYDEAERMIAGFIDKLLAKADRIWRS